jgi:fructose-1-phosphate kinase PfkB-like protein
VVAGESSTLGDARVAGVLLTGNHGGTHERSARMAVGMASRVVQQLGTAWTNVLDALDCSSNP